MKHEHILMIEDDPIHGDSILEFLAKKIGGHDKVKWLYTESEFRSHVNEIKAGKQPVPDLVISDVMLPWCFAEEGRKGDVPKEVIEQTYRRAGTRCHSYFRETQRGFSHIPWVYFTILDEEAIEYQFNSDSRTSHVKKEDGLPALWQRIEEFDKPEWDEREEEVTDRLLGNAKTKSQLLEALKEDWKTSMVWKLSPA